MSAEQVVDPVMQLTGDLEAALTNSLTMLTRAGVPNDMLVQAVAGLANRLAPVQPTAQVDYTKAKQLATELYGELQRLETEQGE